MLIHWSLKESGTGRTRIPLEDDAVNSHDYQEH